MAKSIPEVKIGNEVYQIKDRTAREHLVEVSTTQPTSEDNKLWIKNQENEYEVPTMDEFNGLKSALKDTENSLFDGIRYLIGNGDTEPISPSTTEVGSVSGDIGSTITKGTSSSYRRKMISVTAGDVYLVHFRLPSNENLTNDNIFFTDNNDVIIGKEGQSGIQSISKDTCRIVVIPSGATRMYAHTCSTDTSTLSFYKVLNTITNAINDLQEASEGDQTDIENLQDALKDTENTLFDGIKYFIGNGDTEFIDATAETGQLTGEIGSTINKGTSSSYRRKMATVTAGDVYLVHLIYPSNANFTGYNIFFTDNSDVIISTECKSGIQNASKATCRIVIVPAGATRMYAHTCSTSESTLLFYKVLNPISYTQIPKAKINDWNTKKVTSKKYYSGTVGSTISSGSSNNYGATIVPVTAGDTECFGFTCRASMTQYVIFTNDSNVVVGLGKEVKKATGEYAKVYELVPTGATKAYVNNYITSGNLYIEYGVCDPIFDWFTGIEQKIDNFKKNAGYIDKIPSYYFEHVEEKAEDINALMKKEYTAPSGTTPEGEGNTSAYDMEQFVFFTDYHYDNSGDSVDNTQNSPAMIEYIIRNTGCTFAVHGGDIINNKHTQEPAILYLKDFMEKFYGIGDRLYCCIGNHEYNDALDKSGDGCFLTYAQINKLINSRIEHRMGDMDRFGDYYVDNKATRARYIFMGCDRRNAQHQMMSPGQLEWFFNTIKETPVNYGIILFIHKCLNLTIDTANQQIITAPDTEGTATGKQLLDGVDAFVAGTTYTYNGNQYQFAQNHADFICVFTGHFHLDTSYTTSQGVPVIATTTDCCPKRRTGYDYVNNKWLFECKSGTVQEQAFDVVTIDKEERKIYCTRIGYGQDREFDY